MPNPDVRYDISRVLSRQLAQSRPATTPVASIYTPGDGVEAVVKKVFICNQSAGVATFDLYHDDDGATYDATTQLYKDQTVGIGITRILDDDLYVDSSGNIAVRSAVTSALTFTLYGDEAQVRAR